MEIITQKAVSQMWYQIILGAVLFALSIGILIFVLRQTIKPIYSLVDVTTQIANGELNIQRKDDIRNDEIGMVYTSVHNMAEKLNK